MLARLISLLRVWRSRALCELGFREERRHGGKSRVAMTLGGAANLLVSGLTTLMYRERAERGE